VRLRLALTAQRAWRLRKQRVEYAELRQEQAGAYGGSKRRGASWALYPLGDYVKARGSAEIGEALRGGCEEGELGTLRFADTATKFNRNRKAQERLLILTDRALYTLAPAGLGYRRKHRLPLEALTAVSMSTYADGYLVLHVDVGAAPDLDADLVLVARRKSELVTQLAAALRDRSDRELEVRFSDELSFASKPAGLLGRGVERRTLVFGEEARLEGGCKLLPKDKQQPLKMRVNVAPALGSQARLKLGAGAA